MEDSLVSTDSRYYIRTGLRWTILDSKTDEEVEVKPSRTFCQWEMEQGAIFEDAPEETARPLNIRRILKEFPVRPDKCIIDGCDAVGYTYCISCCDLFCVDHLCGSGNYYHDCEKCYTESLMKRVRPSEVKCASCDVYTPIHMELRDVKGRHACVYHNLVEKNCYVCGEPATNLCDCSKFVCINHGTLDYFEAGIIDTLDHSHVWCSVCIQDATNVPDVLMEGMKKYLGLQ